MEMKAKFIYEAIEDILRPKSEEEILSHLNKLSPNELLTTSARIGFLPGVKLALERGANVHVWNDYALLWASNRGHYDVVELLLKRGANVHAQNDLVFYWASDKDIVELLKKYM
jgi:ankyrin repeat protein